MPVFTPYTAHPARRTGRGLLAPLSHRFAQAGHDPDAAALGDLADQPRAQVRGRVQSPRRRGAAQLFVALVRKMWPMAVG